MDTEIKLAVPDVGTARRLLRAAGFRVHKRRVFESNIMFDNPAGEIRAAAAALRVRDAAGAGSLTYKGKPVASKHKSREELEVEISDGETAARILERLGFRPIFRYEKYRTEYKQSGSSGVATLDETPIGTYLELEGNPRWIDRTARRLGFPESDYITKSYGRLYLEWCDRQKRKPTNMLW